jgi:hypothetical protein
MVQKHQCNMDDLDVVTALLNPEIDDDDIFITLPVAWTEGPNAPPMVVRLKNALYCLKDAPRLWYNDIDTILLSLEFTQFLAVPNLCLRSGGILMLLYVDDISMLYSEDSTKAAIEVQQSLSEKFKITNLSPAFQFLSFEMHCKENGTGISLGQNTFIATGLK